MLIVFYADRKKWNLKLVISFVTSSVILTLGIIIWAVERESWLLWGSLALAMIQGVGLYFWLPAHFGNVRKL
jgi:hypothetical protein